MANISQADFKRYQQIMRQLCDEAEEVFTNAVIKGGGYGIISDRELMLIAYEVVAEYGEGSAALTASLYDTIAMLENAKVPAAQLAQLSFEDVAKAVNAVLRDYTDMNYMSSVVGKMVKQTGADTMMRNAVRDGAEFAWIPAGDTCAFFLTLASNGWQKASKKTIKNGHAEHIHPNCDCQYCVRFDSTTSVEGYNPSAYQKMYYAADGRTPKDKINAMRRAAYAKDKETEGTDNSGLIKLD